MRACKQRFQQRRRANVIEKKTKTILQYYMTARKVFHVKQPNRLRAAFSCDGSTVGQIGRMVGCATLPDNQLAWAAPVVPQRI